MTALFSSPCEFSALWDQAVSVSSARHLIALLLPQAPRQGSFPVCCQEDPAPAWHLVPPGGLLVTG